MLDFLLGIFALLFGAAAILFFIVYTVWLLKLPFRLVAWLLGRK